MTVRSKLALPVADLEASLAFYRERLGFMLAAYSPDADVAAVADPDGDLILLAGPRAGSIATYLDDQQRILQPGQSLSFYERDLAARRAGFLGLSVEIPEIVDTPWDDRTLTVADPDGFVLTFITPAQRSPEELLVAYVQAPEQLAGLLADLDAADLDLSLASGSWTIRQIVHHLADGDSLLMRGIRVALAESGRSYTHNWPGSNEAYINADLLALPIEPAVALFQAIRGYIHQLILATPEPWERAVHDSDDVWTVRRFIILKVRHTLEHLAEIRAIRAEHGR